MNKIKQSAWKKIFASRVFIRKYKIFLFRNRRTLKITSIVIVYYFFVSLCLFQILNKRYIASKFAFPSIHLFTFSFPSSLVCCCHCKGQLSMSHRLLSTVLITIVKGGRGTNKTKRRMLFILFPFLSIPKWTTYF